MSHEPSPQLDFSTLPHYRARSFVPDDADLTDKDTVVGLYQQLLDREVNSAEDLEAWLLDQSELGAALGQAGSALYIRMTCQTDDKQRAEAFKQFIETIPPAVKPLANELDRKYIRLRERFPGSDRRYEVYDRNTRADINIFRDENVPIETKLELLSQEYQTVCGAMTVDFKGEERTMPEMGRFLLEPDRETREAAWRATTTRRLQDKDTLDEIFDKMLPLRGSVARNAGFDNFCDYQFKAYHRFDYTPEDCRQYHDAVERRVVPLLRSMLDKRRETMKLETLRPWDTRVDPTGLPPLKPFQKADGLISKACEAFERTDPELGEQFRMLADMGLLDLASRKGKAPGGYQSTLPETRKPFIFMNAVGVDGDVRTILHEGGHAFHALACAEDPLLAYRHAPMEFCEVASMSMELLAGEHLDVFYDAPEDLARSRREHLEGIINTLPWVATIDAFQHWIYSHPEHTRAQRRAAWIETRERFGGVVDWTGLEDERAWQWHRQLHIFEVPFYYIEYGIAQLGALQLWVRGKKDPAAALAGYRKALALGGSRPLPELFEAAGLKFDFSEDTMAPLVDAVAEAYEAC